ncbi:MAG: Na/Pi symporter [Deltaproteobacteria bacterium]|nr:Na/Pi symporter [Deltaproteobacteria bacterium]
MTWALLESAGGLGLFLLGMVIMTDGLRGLAGDALQRVLRRHTASPTSGAAVGALMTALIQSSSATTVMAVGFAGASLLTFPQALGIVFGANLGTTITGWMVAILGFKLDLAGIMPAAILLGALLRLFGRGRWAQAGFALAGFGLIFMGIAGLQAGMGGLAEVVTPDRFPADTWPGRLRLVAVGIALTLVTQSSSAGVAMAITAVSAGAISFTQAAALVIGMDVGTTVTAAVATVGASLPARRTGWAHVLYNLMTGAAAFVLLPSFVAVLEWLLPGVLLANPELSLVGFHTAFNLLGVVAVLPMANAFGALVERLVPERPGPFTERLEASLLVEPELALRATTPVLEDLSSRALAFLGEELREGARAPRRSDDLVHLEMAVDEVEHYLGQLAPSTDPSRGRARRAAALHVVDQLGRLLRRVTQREVLARFDENEELRAWADRLAAALPATGHSVAAAETELGALNEEIDERRMGFRDQVLADVARGGLDASQALDVTDAYRWLRRMSHHAWRLSHHLGRLGADELATLPERSD